MNRKQIMGFILALIGAICTAIGFSKVTSWEYKLLREYGDTGEWLPTMLLAYGGLLILAIGIILLVFGFQNRVGAKTNYAHNRVAGFRVETEIIIGIVLVVAGCICAVIGLNTMQGWEYQLANEFGMGAIWPLIMLSCGILLALAGVTLLLVFGLNITYVQGHSLVLIGSVLFLSGPVIMGIGYLETETRLVLYISAAIIAVGFVFLTLGRYGPEHNKMK